MNQRITRQIETVEDMTGDMDPKTNFALIVIQTELERYKYIVRSYLRARIAKVGRAKGQTQVPVTDSPSPHNMENMLIPHHHTSSTSTPYITCRPQSCATACPRPSWPTLRGTKPCFTTTTFRPFWDLSRPLYRTSTTRPETSA